MTGATTLARVRSLHGRFGDLLLAAFLTLLVQLDTWTSDGYVVGSKTWFALTGLGMTVPLVLRRRFPLAVVVVVAGAIVVQVAVQPSHTPPDTPFVAWVVCAYSVGANGARRQSLIGVAALVGAVEAWVSYTGDDPVFIPAIMLGFWFAGRVVHSRNRLAAALAARTRELEAERDGNARLAVAKERVRIARELHDVVSHTLGVMVVQAGAERLHEAPGTPAHEALGSIERSGRQALTEMGRLVSMLRTETDNEALGPQPGLDRLAELVARVRGTGLDVELEVEGEPRQLAPGLDVSAYRIVQEALTNTLRHARSQRARVRLIWQPGALEIEVADDGVGPPITQAKAGHGLVGIRERVSLFGGALVTGRSDLGGYLLAVRLPLQQR